MAMLPVQAPSEQGPVTTIRPRRSAGMHRGLASRSDERLVAIAKDGDERAFEILYERHSAAILRYCRSLLRSAQEAEDVKQEAFVLAISALRRGAEPEAFRPWLYRVAHNACMSHLRVRRPVLVADNGVLVGPAGAAAPVDTHREELRQLLDDIGTLPEVQRGALLLREMDGFSYEQVGEVLGLPLSTVRASIFRARRTLQGLADARDADCEEIQAELSRLADRRGRRGRHITSHLHVCDNCREFRDGLRRRPSVLGAITPASPFGPGGLLVALKGKLLGGAVTGGGAGAALVTGGGGAGVAKIAAVAASSIALLAGAGIEADHVIDHGRREAAATPRHVSAAPAPPAEAARGRATTTTAGGAPVTPAVTGVDHPLREGRVVVRTPRGAGGARPRPRETTREDATVSGGQGSARATAPASSAAPDPASAADERHHGAISGSASHDGARDEGHTGARHSEDDPEHGSGGGRDGADSTDSGRERTAPAAGSTPGAGSSSGGGQNGPAKPADDTSHAPTPSGGGSGGPTPTPAPAPAPAPAPQTGTAPPGSSGSGSGSTPAPTPPSNSGPGSTPEDPAVGGSTVDPVPAPADPAPAAPAAPAASAGTAA